MSEVGRPKIWNEKSKFAINALYSLSFGEGWGGAFNSE